MTKTCRKPILVILLTLCLTALCGVMLACNGETPSNATVAYSVTVKTAEGDPAAGVDVKVKKGGASFGTKTTDADGKAAFTLAEDSYTVELSKLPAGYELPEGALALTAEKPELTVTLVKAFAYTVKLVQADGETPFYAEGVKVGICKGGTCLNPSALPESGIVSIEADKDDYEVQIVDLPAGYAYDGYSYGRSTDNYYSGGELSATETEITIRVYQVQSADLSGTAMTADEKTEFNTALGEEDVAHLFTTAALKKGDAAYFMFTPAMSGKYKLYCDTASVYDVGKTFNSTFPVNPIMTSSYGYDLIAENGKAYYLKVTGVSEEQAAPVKFAIVDPVSSYIEYNGINGEIDVKIGKAGSNAVIAFTPTQGGAYKATTQGAALTAVSATTFSDLVKNTYTGNEYAAGSSASVKVTPDVLSSTTIYYMIAANSPSTVKVKIEQLNPVTNTTEIAEVGESLTEYAAAPEGKELIYTPINGEIVYSETDGFYHLEDANGPIVLVNLTGELPEDRFYDGGSLVYLDKNSDYRMKYSFDVTSDADKADLTKGNTYKDYRRFIRGFDDYDYVGVSSIPQVPDTLTVENCYANFVNEDGVYPLTQELKTFLELLYAANEELFDYQGPLDAEPGNKWMFPLCYYGEPAEETEADQIVGEYGFVSNERLEVGDKDAYEWDDDGNMTAWVDVDAGYMTLVIDKNNTYTMYDRDYGELESGNWSKNEDGTYKFGYRDFMGGEVSYTVTYDADAKKVTFTTLDYDGETVITVYVFQLRDEE